MLANICKTKEYVLANGALRYDTAGVISCTPGLVSTREISCAVGLNSRGVNITTPRRLFDTVLNAPALEPRAAAQTSAIDLCLSETISMSIEALIVDYVGGLFLAVDSMAQISDFRAA